MSNWKMLINEYKEHNKYLINEIKEKNARITTLRDELETLHAAYNDAQKEISTLKKQNERLIKRSGETGRQLLKCKNEVRKLDGNWKQFNKERRNARK